MVRGGSALVSTCRRVDNRQCGPHATPPHRTLPSCTTLHNACVIEFAGSQSVRQGSAQCPVRQSSELLLVGGGWWPGVKSD